MTTPATAYRIYILGPDGKVTVGRDVDCPDDTMALEVAGEMLGGVGTAEVWQGARMVGTVKGS